MSNEAFYDIIERNKVRMMVATPGRVYFDNDGGVEYLCTLSSANTNPPVTVSHRFFGRGLNARPHVFEVMHDLQRVAGWIVDCSQEEWIADTGKTYKDYMEAVDTTYKLHALLGSDFYLFLGESVTCE